ncbi:Calcineurin-like phosphoesterase [Frankia torreyi]|uniref:Calcineurin-like phosphoesterase n=1 Tax=Frankia torreyi TaxID=1856 RepID=A0A0D8BD75_9ACTN|nr:MULTISPECIES: metallophosphoesterase [Frankia]KJE21914.1 Calcineurin-like phosphoesterase [Frankia torreyi]KQC35832.1 metallophosphatase [Frankia sp. ACN1ag]
MTTTGPAELTLIQVSDTHLLPAGELMHDRVDTFALLETVAATVASSTGPVAGILLTGDLADDGSPASYRRLRQIVDPLAATFDAPVVYAMGNHDERLAFRAELLNGAGVPVGLDGQAGQWSADHPCDSVHLVDGLRLVALDSTTPGRHDGWLTDAQLAWLADVLATPAPRGTLLIVHHPPLPSPVPTVHLLRLAAAERLADVVAGTDVRMILSGHAHHAGAGALAGIPVWVSPALAYDTDPLPPDGRLRGLLGGGFSRIDLIDGQFVATAIPLSPAGQVYDNDRAERLEFIRNLTPQTTPG